MRAAIVLSIATSLTGCGGASAPTAAPADPGSAGACAYQLPERPILAAPFAGAQPAPAALAQPSRLIVHAELSLATLAKELERHVNPQLADRKGVKLGPAGVLDYHAERGPFSVSIAAGQLVVETPVTGRAQACKGNRCYASCEPRATARAEIPLRLRPDYRFDGSRVSLQFTNGCKVRAFRGMLTVDVTPTLKSILAPQLARVQREIDARLPDVRGAVERGWRKLSAPRALPLAGCAVVEPLGLVQGPVHESKGIAHARFALLARPELRGDCPERARNVSLPPLSTDLRLPDEDTVTLGMELPLTELARAFEASTPEAGAEPHFDITGAKVKALGKSIAADLALSGALCGAVTLHAAPTFVGEEGVIALDAAQFDATDRQRIESAGLDPDALARRLAQRPRLAAPIPMAVLRAAPPAVASLFSDATFTLSARLSSLRAAGAAARSEQLVTWVDAKGSLLLKQR